jgi:hypothetical protein
MLDRNVFAAVGAAITLTASPPVFAQTPSRYVIVNNAVMNDAQLLVLDALNCSTPVPDGRYWLNVNTGAWGFQGGPQQGVIGAQCRQARSAPPRKSGNCQGSWEDRMANCYGVRSWGDTRIYRSPVYQ